MMLRRRTIRANVSDEVDDDENQQRSTRSSTREDWGLKWMLSFAVSMYILGVILSIMTNPRKSQQTLYSRNYGEKDDEQKASQHSPLPPASSATSAGFLPLCKNLPIIKDGNIKNKNNTIPRTMWFIHEHDPMKTKNPKHLYENVNKTVSMYRNAWNDDKAKVNFLSLTDCGVYVAKAKPELIPYYYSDSSNSNSSRMMTMINEEERRNVCTMALLYVEGGYYFGVDLEVVNPLLIDEESGGGGVDDEIKSGLTFVGVETVDEYETSFHIASHMSFIASVPKHVILEETIETILHSLNNHNKEQKSPSVVATLFDVALQRYKTREERMTTLLLREVDYFQHPDRGAEDLFSEQQNRKEVDRLISDLYPNLPLRNEKLRNKINMCNRIIHQEQTQTLYFRPFILGSTRCPFDVRRVPKLKLDHLLHHAPPKNASFTKSMPIPRILWFTYKHDLFKTPSPPQFASNVQHTVSSYRKAWEDADNKNNEAHQPPADAIVLTDDECISLIFEAEPKLLLHFYQEFNGSYRADLCRVAALYLYGGYYFDVDMEVVKPLLLDNKQQQQQHTIGNNNKEEDNVSFSSAWNPDQSVLFQSWMASKPRHPILKYALQRMLQYYLEIGKYASGKTLLGPQTLADAYMWDTIHGMESPPLSSSSSSSVGSDKEEEKEEGKENIGGLLFLREDPLGNNNIYPDLPRRDGRDIMCNHIVHDPKQKEVYFYSRIVGSSNCPFLDDPKTEERMKKEKLKFCLNIVSATSIFILLISMYREHGEK